ncbi:MAG: ABC transporter substrate-binding protein [Clostridia bacterium]|nr:ABC transporter substrate-binding protein [Clostridia bacterium]
MKKLNLKKVLSLVSAAVLTLSLAACATTPSANATPTPSAPGSGSAAGETVKIGIIQFAPHPSLDNCTNGTVQGLEAAGYKDGENGVTIDIQNAQGSADTATLMAKNMVTGKYDVIIGVATPAAMSAYSAAKDSKTRTIFCAVSDPVAAGLVKALDNPQSGTTGTADTLNLEGQLKMIRALLPEAKKIGILYTTSEPNSVSNLKKFEELAPKYEFTIESVGITNESEVASGAATLVAKGVDCVNNFTDNNVVNNLSTLLHATDAAGIPVFGSEEEQVRNGCVASESLDYVALGVKTGEMAAGLLQGGDIMTTPVAIVADSTPVYSQKNLDQFGLTLPEEYSSAANLDE